MSKTISIYEEGHAVQDFLAPAGPQAVYDELQAAGTLRTGSAESAVIRPKDPLDDLSFQTESTLHFCCCQLGPALLMVPEEAMAAFKRAIGHPNCSYH